MLKGIAGVMVVVAAVAYPLVVSVGLHRYGLSQMAWVIVAAAVIVAGARAMSGKRSGLRALLLPPVLVATLALLGWWLREERWLLAMPSLFNLALLLSFGQSLWLPPPLVERFARLTESELSPAEITYCRQVTKVWCGFFLLNALTAGILAWAAPLAWWVLYTGLISYVLVGALMAGEYVVRKWRFRKFGAGLQDRLLASFLTPRPHKP